MRTQLWQGMTARELSFLPEENQQDFLADLNADELNQLRYAWEFWAREEQLPPPGDWFIWLLRMGRGGGKTRCGAEWVVARARDQPQYPIALIGQTKADARDTMIEVGDSSILRVSPPWFMPKYEPSKRRLTWPNGAVAVVFSGDEPDQLRGPQHGTVWMDELAKFKYPQQTWDNMELGLRLGLNPQVLVTTTPRPIPIIRNLVTDPMCVDVRGSTYRNMANLAPSFIRRILHKYEGTTLGRQELHGDILNEIEGALWNHAMIEFSRVSERQVPELERVIIGVDPPGSVNTECGIVAAGMAHVDGDAHYYIIGDSSMKGTPGQWGAATIGAYDLHEANLIVGEVNFGGDMVERNISIVDESVTFRAVRASRGKAIRAEPVAHLYERNRAHNVGSLPTLEDECCTWVPGSGMRSPNRLDALVWVVIALLEEGGGWNIRY